MLAKSPANGYWFPNLYALPGDTLPIAIVVQNDGNIATYGTTISFTMPRGLSYIQGSASVGPSAIAAGRPIPDRLIVPNFGDISLGTLQPGQTVVVRFKVHIHNDVHDGIDLKETAIVTASNAADRQNALTVNVQ
jgi:uncharacterized repeat protein (TIGR01451 family)